MIVTWIIIIDKKSWWLYEVVSKNNNREKYLWDTNIIQQYYECNIDTYNKPITSKYKLEFLYCQRTF